MTIHFFDKKIEQFDEYLHNDEKLVKNSYHY